MRIVRSALAAVSRFDAVHTAWKSLFERSSARSRKSSGVDDESLLDFDRSPAAGCRNISHQMRDPGGYSFSALRPVPVPKGEDRYRIICVPTVRDRIVQRALNQFLASGDRCGLANEVSYGFIPNRSVEKAVKQAQQLRRGKRWVYKTDITTFFDSIHRDTLRDKIVRHVRDRSLHDILIAASQCEIAPTYRSNAKKIESAGIKAGRGVRQGMPLSPFFANLLLKNFDRAIQAAGISMVRYADDLVCFTESSDACNAIHEVVGKALEKEGLTVPPIGQNSKSKICGPEDSADFLGLQLKPQNGDYVLEISGKQTQKIHQRIVSFADFDSLERQGITLSSFFRRIDGLIAGYAGAYEFAHNSKHLETVLDSARIEAVQSLFTKGLGINAKGLSLEKRKFLGIV